jgi:hypothetical protein
MAKPTLFSLAKPGKIIDIHNSHFHESERNTQIPFDIRRSRDQGLGIIDVLRTKHEGSGTDPHEDEDDFEDDAGDLPDPAVRDHGVLEVSPTTMDGDDEGENKGDD